LEYLSNHFEDLGFRWKEYRCGTIWNEGKYETGCYEGMLWRDDRVLKMKINRDKEEERI
jgi:hypothetical protein